MGLTCSHSSTARGERGAARVLLGIKPWVCRLLQPNPPQNAAAHHVARLASRKTETSGVVLLE